MLDILSSPTPFELVLAIGFFFLGWEMTFNEEKGKKGKGKPTKRCDIEIDFILLFLKLRQCHIYLSLSFNNNHEDLFGFHFESNLTYLE